jgi:hypothetical protein
MGRKFVIDEADLKEMLIALMEYHMNRRDGVDNWEWYGESSLETVQDFYPEPLSIDDIRENDIGFEECAEAMIEAGKYPEQVDMDGFVNQLAGLINLNEAMGALYG